MKKRNAQTFRQGPPRVAVALEYDGEGAPKVTAKGSDELADQIMAIAEEHGIPLQENRDLVRMLAQIEIGREIPPALYRVVAEVIAFAYIIRGKLPSGHSGPGED